MVASTAISSQTSALAGTFVSGDVLLQVFVETMMNTPNSGFALYGMAESLRSLNRTKDAAQIDEVYKKAWENADGPLDSSCPSFSRIMSPVMSRGHRRSLA